MTRAALLAALAILLLPGLAGAQMFMDDDIPQYTLSGRLLASYGGTWASAGDRIAQSQLLTEGAELDLGGWIYQSRLVKFRAMILATRLDDLAARQGSFSLGYGGTLFLFSKSIVPVSLTVSKNYAFAGSNVVQAGTTSTTVLAGSAQLVAPELPHVDLRAQHQLSQDMTGENVISDEVNGGVYGGTPLQRYAGVVTWDSTQFGEQPRTAQTMASLSDDIFPGPDTRAHLGATITQGSGFGGADYTGYDAEAYLLSRLGAHTIANGGYTYSEIASSDRDQTSHMAIGGATIDLKPLPIFLGEGLSGGEVRLDGPGLHQVIDSFSAAQGVAVTGRRGPLTGSISASGQAGYTSVVGGASGTVLGYGLNGMLRDDIPGAATSLSAQYARRDDHSSAETSTRLIGANLVMNLTRLAPLMLLPTVSYLRIDQQSPMAVGTTFGAASPLAAGQAPLLGAVPGTGGLLAGPALATSAQAATAAAPAQPLGLGLIDNSNLTAGLTGFSPLWHTRASFAAGFDDSWSQAVRTSNSFLFAHLSDAFRLGYGSFGNLAADLNHVLGGGTTASATAAVVWSFRESTVSASYTYTQFWPAEGIGSHTLAFLYTRTFGTSFLPETR